MKIKDQKLLWESIELFTTSNALGIILGALIALLGLIVSIFSLFHIENIDVLLKIIGLFLIGYIASIIVLVYVVYRRKVIKKEQDLKNFEDRCNLCIELNNEL